MIKLLLITIAFMVFAIALFSVRVLFVKNGQFRGTCASNNPALQKEGVACSVCGRLPDEPCGENELPKIKR